MQHMSENRRMSYIDKAAGEEDEFELKMDI